MNGIYNLKIEMLEFTPKNLTKLILSNNNFVKLLKIIYYFMKFR